jgi:integrase
MLLLTGARKREVLDARWCDIDAPRSFWRIPKTKSGHERHVPLSTAALSLLATIPRRDDCDYIFASPKTLRPFVSIFISWHTARTAAGLGDVRIHDLRHSFASFLVNAGCSLYEVQKILGHASVVMTQRYSHLSQDSLLRAVSHAAPYLVSGNTIAAMPVTATATEN